MNGKDDGMEQVIFFIIPIIITSDTRNPWTFWHGNMMVISNVLDFFVKTEKIDTTNTQAGWSGKAYGQATAATVWNGLKQVRMGGWYHWYCGG